MLEEYFKELEKFVAIPKEEEHELLVKAKSGDRKAYERMINSNLKFVISIAKSYQGQGLPLEDLISEGNIGLIKGLERFDTNKKVRFISYAVWWVRQAILNAIHENAKSIRIPLNKISNVSKIDKMRNELSKHLGREPSLQELEDALENTDILRDEQYSYTMIELDRPQTENEKTLSDVISEEIQVDPEDTRKEFLIELDQAIAGFPERDKKILKMYYGIGYPRAYTLNEVGEEFSLTRERIRQIKKRALDRLMLKHRNTRLRKYL